MKDIGVVAWAILAAVSAAGVAVPEDFQTGMTWGFAERPGYFASPEAKADVDAMYDAGVRWVVLTPNVWQEAYCSLRQFADFERSIPDFELMDIIDYIHRKGMCVQLRPMLECHDGTGRHGVIVGDDREPSSASWWSGFSPKRHSETLSVLKRIYSELNTNRKKR